MSLNYEILDNMSDHFGDAFYLLDSKKFSQNFDEFLSEFNAYTIEFLQFASTFRKL